MGTCHQSRSYGGYKPSGNDDLVLRICEACRDFPTWAATLFSDPVVGYGITYQVGIGEKVHFFH